MQGGKIRDFRLHGVFTPPIARLDLLPLGAIMRQKSFACQQENSLQANFLHSLVGPRRFAAPAIRPYSCNSRSPRLIRVRGT